jgi:hypothetical protein
MHILLVSIGVAALALLLLVVPVLALQLALRLFASPETRAPEAPPRPLKLSRASS